MKIIKLKIPDLNDTGFNKPLSKEKKASILLRGAASLFVYKNEDSENKNTCYKCRVCDGDEMESHEAVTHVIENHPSALRALALSAVEISRVLL